MAAKFHSVAAPEVPAHSTALERRSELVRELEELIAALDRRVPRVEAAGEPAIASEAAALRARAVARLAELRDGDGIAATDSNEPA